MRMMSPKRDQRVLPQAALIQQQQLQQQGYNTMPMIAMQQQPQYQYQPSQLPGPPSYLPQPYATNTGAGPGMMRVGPRMLPVGVVGAGGGVPGVAGVVPSNGLINAALPPSSTIRIPVGYYSQHPSMMPLPHQMAYSTAPAAVPIPQTNQAYYGELIQHPLQVSQRRRKNSPVKDVI